VSEQVHLFDIDVPGKITFKESEMMSSGHQLTMFDTSQFVDSLSSLIGCWMFDNVTQCSALHTAVASCEKNPVILRKLAIISMTRLFSVSRYIRRLPVLTFY